jgi:hypothetical protein
MLRPSISLAIRRAIITHWSRSFKKACITNLMHSVLVPRNAAHHVLGATYPSCVTVQCQPVSAIDSANRGIRSQHSVQLDHIATARSCHPFQVQRFMGSHALMAASDPGIEVPNVLAAPTWWLALPAVQAPMLCAVQVVVALRENAGSGVGSFPSNAQRDGNPWRI